jgi:hypothetical protein
MITKILIATFITLVAIAVKRKKEKNKEFERRIGLIKVKEKKERKEKKKKGRLKARTAHLRNRLIIEHRRDTSATDYLRNNIF